MGPPKRGRRWLLAEDRDSSKGMCLIGSPPRGDGWLHEDRDSSKGMCLIGPPPRGDGCLHEDRDPSKGMCLIGPPPRSGKNHEHAYLLSTNIVSRSQRPDLRGRWLQEQGDRSSEAAGHKARRRPLERVFETSVHRLVSRAMGTKMTERYTCIYYL